MDEKELIKTFLIYCEKHKNKVNDRYIATLISSIHFLKNKAKSLEDIYNNAKYIITSNFAVNPEDLKLIDDKSQKIISDYCKKIEEIKNLNKEYLEKCLKELIIKYDTNFKGVGQPLRIALVGSKFGPGIYDVLLSLDKNEIINRLKNIIKG